MERGAKFVCYATCKNQLRTPASLITTSRGLGHFFVEVKRRFDIEPDPVTKRKNLLETLGNHASGMKTDLKTHFLDRFHPSRKMIMDRGFPAREHNAIKVTFTRIEKMKDLFKWNGRA